MTRRVTTLALLVSAATTPMARAQGATDSNTVRFGAFVDAYYAWDSGRPAQRDRAFTTQPARHNEFNVNLAFVEAVLSGPRTRGRLALQAGTSVQSNYAGEPRVGTISGPDLARLLQEATVGVRLTPALWVDGGIYLSHVGSEGWISRDNPTYTRSLIADYSPYYQSGVRLTWQARPTVSAQLHLVNGWQVIGEGNGGKAIGSRIDWTVSPRATLSAYNLVGNEAPDTATRRLRAFQGASLRLTPTERLLLLATVDGGVQDAPDGHDPWYGTSLIARMQATATVAVAGRLERYDDPHQVIVATGGADPFRATGGSLGLDVVPAPRTLWRTELRGLRATRAVFPRRDATSHGNAVLVTSLALTF